MTTGNKLSGLEASPSWSRKTWSGVDDRSKDNSYSVEMFRMLRPAMDRSYDHLGNLYYSGYNQNFRPWADGAAKFGWLDPNFETKVINALAQEVRGHSFNAAVFAAELPDALRMLLHSVRALKEITVGFRHLDPGRVMRSFTRLLGQPDQIYQKLPRRKLNHDLVAVMGKDKRWQTQLSAGDVSAGWLALQYGWKPLVSDIYALFQVISAWSKPGTREAVYRVSRNDKGVIPTSLCTLKAVGAKVTVKNHMAIKIRLVEQPSFLEGLGLMDPASVVWEKTPLSFVLDWALPIGPFLAARAFVHSISTSAPATITRFYTYNTGIAAGSFVKGPTCGFTNNYRFVCGGNSYQAVKFTRSIENLSVPSPSFKSLEKIWSLAHLQNAAALLHQILR